MTFYFCTLIPYDEKEIFNFFDVSKDSLLKIIATYSNIRAWEFSRIEELAGYSPWDCKRVGTQLND